MTETNDKQYIKLSDRLKQLQVEMRKIESSIQNCNHQWIETEILTVPMKTPIKESTGGAPYFGKIQQRTCEICGLKQERKRHGPEIQWTDWGEPTTFFAQSLSKTGESNA